jgi:repressor LexA
MFSDLTPRQKQIFDYLIEYAGERGYPPTLMEVRDHFGFSCVNAVNDHLKALARKGYITRLHGRARGIEFTAEVKRMPGLPLIGRIAAGTPIMAEENFQGFMDLKSFFRQKDGGLFVLKVDGDSMSGVGIYDGDWVVVKRTTALKSGEIGVVYIGEDATVKRVITVEGGLRLQPENPAYKPIVLRAGRDFFQIGGKVVGVVRKL